MRLLKLPTSTRTLHKTILFFTIKASEKCLPRDTQVYLTLMRTSKSKSPLLREHWLCHHNSNSRKIILLPSNLYILLHPVHQLTPKIYITSHRERPYCSATLWKTWHSGYVQAIYRQLWTQSSNLLTGRHHRPISPFWIRSTSQGFKRASLTLRYICILITASEPTKR